MGYACAPCPTGAHNLFQSTTCFNNNLFSHRPESHTGPPRDLQCPIGTPSTSPHPTLPYPTLPYPTLTEGNYMAVLENREIQQEVHLRSVPRRGNRRLRKLRYGSLLVAGGWSDSEGANGSGTNCAYWTCRLPVASNLFYK